MGERVKRFCRNCALVLRPSEQRCPYCRRIVANWPQAGVAIALAAAALILLKLI
jgi:RNA polymerase subunit RPABC4/transcription elongation factor Spt4